VIVFDTSVLVDALTGTRRSAEPLRRAIDDGERLLLTSLVLYEWRRGPRADDELAAQEALFPAPTAIAFGPLEAATAARLYREVPRARSRQFDLGIAAYALTRDAGLWTLNPQDFRDIPGLKLYPPRVARGEDDR
jgi:predicted nucleic acid-binding protein